MSALTCNGVAVLSGQIRMPRRGLWVAELTLDAQTAPSGTITIATFDGKLSINGTLRRADVYADTVRVLVVAGRGDLDAVLPSLGYRSTPARIPIADVLGLAGEALSATADAAMLAQQLPFWARLVGPAGLSFASLVDAIGGTWRALPDGSIWVGSETWPAAPSYAYELLESNPARDDVTLGVEAPWLLPGVTFLGKRVSLVVHRVEAAGFRTEVFFEKADATEGRLLEGLRKIVAKFTSRIDYLAAHRARVVSQNADGTLELFPDSAKIPAISKVPVFTLPGTTVKVVAGARAYLEFADGDPTKPIVRSFEPGGLIEIQIGGTLPIARQGDSVVCTMPPTIPVIGTVSGNPFVGVITITSPMVGQVITGSGKAKA